MNGKIPDVPFIPDIHIMMYNTYNKICSRAELAVALAGEQGEALAKATSTEFAAMQIYMNSGYAIPPSEFYKDNEETMADMERLALLARSSLAGLICSTAPVEDNPDSDE